MRRHLRVIALVVVGMVVLTQSVGASGAKNSSKGSILVGVNPLGLIWGVFSVDGEYNLNDNSGVVGRFTYWNISSLDIGGYGWDIYMLSLGGAYRFYLNDKVGLDEEAPGGLYAGPDAGIGMVKATYRCLDIWTGATTEYSDSSVVFMLGGEVGYRFLFKSGFFVDLYSSYLLGLGSVEAGPYSYDATIGGLGLGLTVGLTL